jgi:hypothetical protein
MVTHQLERHEGPLDDATRAALRHAIARLAELEQQDPASHAQLGPSRQHLIVAASGAGLDVHTPAAGPADDAPLVGEADDRVLLLDLERRIGQLVDTLKIHGGSPDLDVIVSATSPAILDLMQQAEAVLRGADSRNIDLFSAEVRRIQGHVDRLYERAQSSRTSLLTSKLDDIFESERHLLRWVGIPPGNRRRAYYAEERGDANDPATSSDGLIESIIGQFTSTTDVHQSAIGVVASILQAPEAAPTPEILEQVLMTVITDFIGSLPLRFGGLLQRVARLAESPGTRAASSAATAVAGSSSPATDTAAPRVAPAAEPPAATEHGDTPFAAGLFNTAKKIITFGTGELKSETKGVFRAGARPSGTEMKLAFIEEAHLKTLAYMSGPLNRHARQMVPHLQKVPPEQLQALLIAMEEGVQLLYASLIQDLLAQWMNFRAGIALGGTDEHGDLVMDGPLDDVVARPGTLKVSLGLPALPGGPVTLVGLEIDDISPEVRRRLSQGGSRPLTELAVHRYFSVAGPPTAGGREQHGEIYMNPLGVLHVEHLHGRKAVAAFGRAPSMGAWLSVPEPSDSEVLEGARLILQQVQATTKDVAR